MTTSEFIAGLEPHSNDPLVFSAAGQRVAGGYHVTEFKAISVNAMDCGGRYAKWDELVLQVLPSAAESPEAPAMSVGKFLSIYERVAAGLPMAANALVRVEYGAAGASAVSYPVAAVRAEPAEVIVELTEPIVACKASGAAVGNVPTVRTHVTPRTAGLDMATRGTDCCAPGS